MAKTREFTQELLDEFVVCLVEFNNGYTPSITREIILNSLPNHDTNKKYFLHGNIKFSNDFARNGLFMFKLIDERNIKSYVMVWQVDETDEDWQISLETPETFEKFTGMER